MPLFYSHIVDSTTRLAIWHLTEGEAFFLEKVSIGREITHPHKRLQHLAGRYLLQYLIPEFPTHLVKIAATSKPFIEDGSYHFSISHCGDYAAAIVSTTRKVGIDIEIPTDKIKRVQHKFLTNEEFKNISTQTIGHSLINNLTLAWSAKESIFKWYGNGEVDFKQHMHLNKIEVYENEGLIDALFTKEKSIAVQIQFRFIKPLILSWLDTF